MKAIVFKERGQALVVIALASIVLLGFVALAVDGSSKYSDRRHAQNAADTAALAGALENVTGLTAGKANTPCATTSGYANSPFCLDIIGAAWDVAEENGYDGALPDGVDIYSPHISGPYVGKNLYVQVIITSYVDTY